MAYRKTDLDPSLAFTALLDLSPAYGAMESRAAERVTSRFLSDFYASGETNMYAYARDSWGHLSNPGASLDQPEREAGS